MKVAMFFPEILAFLLVIAPILLLYVFLKPIITKNLQSKGLENLLSDTDLVPGTKEGDNPNVDVPKRSSSRLIMLMSGITAIIIAACLVSYYIYMDVYSVKSVSGLNLNELANIILALGIGIIPYAVNKIKGKQ
ncbi:hypothetical protein OU798_02200 [Prolixibacteraceae bacterium Z1-6]|uniref:Uncharacterized protein n=1 Tax=Draconibacterium aestuarii TaxID=2998507 RepID=A0A9X3F232_9BACT|nr:hypothetical protein [Prolixibacteraceae bacterium Z1-6]